MYFWRNIAIEFNALETGNTPLSDCRFDHVASIILRVVAMQQLLKISRKSGRRVSSLLVIHRIDLKITLHGHFHQFYPFPND